MGIRAVFFDVGETIVDETRMRRVWASWLGVSMFELDAALANAIRCGEHHRTAFQRLRPGFDLDRARKAGGDVDQCQAGDLYPDVLPCFRALKGTGRLVGIAGNQSQASEDMWRQLPVDLVGSSGGGGTEKPSPTFFERLTVECGCAPDEIAYVGDRLDNDVLPARAAGMIAVFLPRGPWAAIQAGWPEASKAHVQISSLLELPSQLHSLRPKPT